MDDASRRVGERLRLQSAESMKVARSVAAGKSTLRRWLNDWWMWDAQTGWRMLCHERVRDMLWLELEEAMVPSPKDHAVLERYAPDRWKVEGVARALEAVCRLDLPDGAPAWIGHGPCPPALQGGDVATFRGAAVNARTGEVVEVGPEWFDPATLTVRWEPDAACPRWEAAVREWSCGDPAWEELLARWMGYCLMGSRRYSRWMLMYGKIRAGKGTIASTLRKLLGRDAYLSSSLEDMAGGFGLDGVERSRVICVGEVSELDGRDGEKVCRVIKNVVGRDPLTVDAKFMRQQRNVVVNATVMLQSNEIPRLPNKGRGLSGKMLVLPFENSFEGRESLDLDRELSAELPGIAAWCMRGAMRLEASQAKDRWPQTDGGRKAMRLYHLQNNPFDAFLEARFVPNEGGFVDNDRIRQEWDDWRSKNKVLMRVSANMLPIKLVQGSSWNLRQQRLPESQGHARGVAGMSLRRVAEDDH